MAPHPETHNEPLERPRSLVAISIAGRQAIGSRIVVVSDEKLRVRIVNQNTVYFLGAGATKADHPHVPLGDELLHVILKDGLAGDNLGDFLKSNFEDCQLQPDAAQDARPRLDDVFTLIDAAMSGRAPFPAGIQVESILGLRQSLVCAIGKALSYALPAVQSPTAEAFTTHLCLNGEGCVISTNYDITMDNAFYLGDPPNTNYGVVIRAAVDRGAVPDSSFRQAEVRHYQSRQDEGLIRVGRVPLLKLHGSLNWLYCPRCDELDVFLGGKAAVTILDNPELGRCAMEHCTGRYEALVVGPSLEQKYDNRILKETWARADRALRDAESLVFIGYSMPEADYLIRNMVARRFAKRSEEVTVVGYGEPQTSSESALVKARIQRLLPNATFRWDGFQGFVQDMACSWFDCGAPPN